MDFKETINSQIIGIQIPPDQMRLLERDALDKEMESLRLEKEALHRHLATYKRILGCEVGHDIDIRTHIPIPGIWKVRAGEKNYLKSELIKIIDLRRRNDPTIPFDPKCLPSDVDANRDCLLSASQMDALMDLYVTYNTHRRTADEQEAAKCIKDYQQMIKDYEEKLLHNSAMADEIKATRRRIKELQIQFAEDQDFMNYLISMESCREKVLKKIKSSSDYKQSLHELDGELVKYKGMLDANQQEERLHLRKLDDMQRRLSNAQAKLIDAEKLCEENRNRLASITKEVPLLIQMPGFKMGNGSEEKATPNLYTEDKLEMARSENDFLKKLLREEIFFKDKDFDSLKNSLDSVASAYQNKIILMRDKPEKTPKKK